jgi:hypothetical protein
VISDAHGSKTPGDRMAVGRIAVPDKVVWCFIPREGIGDLAGDPLRCRIMISASSRARVLNGETRMWATRLKNSIIRISLATLAAHASARMEFSLRTTSSTVVQFSLLSTPARRSCCPNTCLGGLVRPGTGCVYRLGGGVTLQFSLLTVPRRSQAIHVPAKKDGLPSGLANQCLGRIANLPRTSLATVLPWGSLLSAACSMSALPLIATEQRTFGEFQ